MRASQRIDARFGFVRNRAERLAAVRMAISAHRPADFPAGRSIYADNPVTFRLGPLARALPNPWGHPEPGGAVMQLTMNERHVGAVTVLDLAGKLTIDEGAQRLKDKINSLIVQGRTQVVLNLAEVSYIDSGGLGQLVSSFGSLARCGALKLLHVSKRNHDLLSITRLVTIFDTFDSEDDALKSFQQDAAVAPVPGVID
jgi:anti-sigma B factor antagonist